MTPFEITMTILISIALVCFAIALSVPANRLSDNEWAVVFGLLFAAVVSSGILGYNWDDILVSRADKFMQTRDAAYACADLGPSSCKKSILEWQKDSAWYADKVSGILKNIKETK